jgi:hypothetical protein
LGLVVVVGAIVAVVGISSSVGVLGTGVGVGVGVGVCVHAPSSTDEMRIKRVFEKVISFFPSAVLTSVERQASHNIAFTQFSFHIVASGYLQIIKGT